MRFYQLDSKELQKELETDFEYGLINKEVDLRRKICGYNTRFSKPKLTKKSFCMPLLLLSLIISIVYLCFAIFNKNITFTYFSVASIVLAVICQGIIILIDLFLSKGIYLSSFNKPYTLTVLRNGVKCDVKYNEIVYGDIVFVEKGDYIPFDGIILSSNGLVTDESDIIGKDRVPKHPGVISKDNVKPEELSNTVLCDSYVVHGKAKIVVTDVSARVYVSKSGKVKNKSINVQSKIIDISTLFLTIFSIFCIIFTIICGLISKDYAGIITTVLLFAILILSGFMKRSYNFIYKKAFLDLNKNGVFLNSYFDVENLNNTDILLLSNKHIFDKKSEISGFISENSEYTPLSNVTKSNFGVFLYGAFALEQNSSEQKSCVKVLKKLGIDFDDSNSMCPTLASYHNDSTGVNMSARAYDGNNMIIVCGDYSIVKSMCSNSLSESEVEKLNSTSTEMLAVAIKNVDVISDDMNEQTAGFTIIGVLGINKKIDKSTNKKIHSLNQSGVHPIILFSGNQQALYSTFSSGIKAVSMTEIDTVSKRDITDIDFIYDFNGDVDAIFNRFSSVGLSFAHIGNKTNHKHSVSFKKLDEKPFINKDADIVISNGFSSVFESFVAAKKSSAMIKRLFQNYSLFCAFFVVCGVLFSLLYKDVLVNTISAGLLLLIFLPVALIMFMCIGVSERDIYQNTKSSEFFGNEVLSYTIIASVVFLLLCTCLKFIIKSDSASAFLLTSFITFICFDDAFLKDKILLSVISLIPSVVSIIIMVSPISFLFGYPKVSFIALVLAMVLGVGIKYIVSLISRSVKI